MSAIEDNKFITPFGPEYKSGSGPESQPQDTEVAGQVPQTPEQQVGTQGTALAPEITPNAGEKTDTGVVSAEAQAGAAVAEAERVTTSEERKQTALLNNLNEALRKEGPSSMAGINIHDYEGVPANKILDSIMKDN